MIIFKNWNIAATPGVIARQFDHKTRRLEMTGDMPTGWEWTAEFRYGDFMDVFLLEPMEGGFGIDLTADQLCFPGNYEFQVRGLRDGQVRYTNAIRAFIPENLAGTPDEEGEANWPKVTSEFKQLEERIWGSVDTAKGHAEDAQHSAEQAEDNMNEAGKYAEQARKYSDLINPEEIDTRLANKGDNLEFDNDEGLLYLTSAGERISDGIKVATITDLRRPTAISFNDAAKTMTVTLEGGVAESMKWTEDASGNITSLTLSDGHTIPVSGVS